MELSRFFRICSQPFVTVPLLLNRTSRGEFQYASVIASRSEFLIPLINALKAAATLEDAESWGTTAGFGLAAAGSDGFLAGAVVAERGASAGSVVERLVFCSAGLALRGRPVGEEFEFCAEVETGRPNTKKAETNNIFLNKACSSRVVDRVGV